MIKEKFTHKLSASYKNVNHYTINSIFLVHAVNSTEKAYERNR